MEDRARSQAGLTRLCAGLGFTGVACGALGAHAVKALGPEALDWWNTGARYHLVHALAVGLVAALHPTRAWISAGLFTAGVVLFSGSLYVLALTHVKALGMVTPIGGLTFLAGWAVLFFGARR
ncbi:MAG: DUF423 domain-containing protein [Myxococcaceae bacterium]|nr:DUF423 domain-containing protein [Myxococcaceae bacterium]